MVKRFNMLALIVLLVFQTMITPVAATAQELVEQEGANAETTEDVDSSDDVDVAEETEGTENEDTDVDEEESDEEPEEKVSSGDKGENISGGDPTTDEIVENTEIISKNEAEENTPKKQAVATVQAEEVKDLGSGIFTDVNIVINGEPLEEGTTEIDITDDLHLQVTFDWELSDDVNLNAGDWAQIKLPDALKGVANQATGSLLEDGLEVGTYEVTEDGYLRVEFNNELTNRSDRSGEVGFLLEFDLKEFEEDVNQSIKFEDPINKEFVIKAKPSGEVHDIKKYGVANENINPEYLNWTIDINTKLESLTNATVEDTIPEGLELDFDSIEVYELKVGYEGKLTEGNKIDNFEITEIDSGFKVDLGETDKAYRIKYKTDIVNFSSDFTNDVVLKDKGEEKAKDKYTITGLERGSLIEKEGDLQGEQIIWTIDVNKSESSLKNVEVLDEIPNGLTVDSIKVWKLNKAGNDWGYGEWVGEYEEFPVDLGDIDGAYRFEVITDIDYSSIEEYTKELDFLNEAVIEVNGEQEDQDDASVKVKRESLLEKGGWESTDYGDSKISWKIDVNKAKHPIEDAVITDTIGEGLELIKDSIKVFDVKNNKELAATDYQFNITADGFTIHLGNIDSEYRIEYDTKITENLPAGQEGYKNKADLGGNGLEGVGEDDITKEPTIKPDKNNIYKKENEYWKVIDDITYDGLNYTEKTLSWKLTVDAIKEEITELKITDTFAPEKSMKFIADSIRVLKGGEIVPSDQYTLTDDGVNGFELKFNGPLERAKYEIYFKTSFDSNDVIAAGGELNPESEYKNTVTYTGKTKDVEGNVKEFTDKDDAQYNVKEEFVNGGKKSGTLDRETRTINWEIFANASGRNLTGGPFVITDTLTQGDQSLNENVKVYEYSLGKDGNFIKGDEITDGFTVVYNNDKDGFTLTFEDGVDKPVLVEFSSKVNGISEEWYKNAAKVTDITEQEKTYDAEVKYEGHHQFINKETTSVDGNITYTDDEIDWKISINESLSDIKNAVFKDTISEGLILVNDSIKVYKDAIDEDNIVDIAGDAITITPKEDGATELSINLGNIEESRYFITYQTVVVAINEKISNEASLFGAEDQLGNSSKKEYTARQSSWGTGSGKGNRGQIEITKVDSETKEPIASPAIFELYYLLNGEKQIVTGEAQVTESGKIQYGNLPFRTYYLKEVEAPEGYVLSKDVIEIEVNKEDKEIELTVENSAELEIVVTKVWDDAENQDGIRPESITVNLLANGEEVDSTTLSEENDWSATFTDLSPIDENGEEIEYTIEEVDVTDYEVNISGTIADGFEITNTHVPAVIDIEGTKTWDDANNQDGKRPELITVRLLANGTEIENVEVTEENEWKYSFTDLPKFENGKEVNYTVQEDGVEDYSTEIAGFDITNSYTPEQTSINVVKAWKDADNQDGIRPESVTVKLFTDGEETDKTVELTEENKWQASFTELDVYANGEKIVYTVEEVSVDGYDTSISGTSEDGFVITNTHKPELIDINGTKTWEDAENQDGKRPESITVRLLANGTEIENVEVTEENEWKYSFTDLPKFENGKEVNYTVQEDGVEDYSTEINGFDITNSYTPEQTSINVVKTWKDAGNQDGIRPESVTVKLFADGEETDKEAELNAENNWQADFTELDVYANGKEIEYTIEEVAVDGYDVVQTGTAEDGYVLTNIHEPELISLEGTKTWKDANNQDGKRPESITVRLLANGAEVDSVEVNEENEWKYSFTDLPKFENGEEITYTVQENQVEDYSTEIDGFNITNSYTPGKTSVNVLKVWEDAENQNDKRPETIEVVLLADGETTDQTLVLNETNNWQGDFSELDEYKDGQQIKYTVEEVAVDEYRTEITGNSETGFVITNTLKTYAIGDYTWIDSNNDGIQDEDEEVLPGVIVELYDESGENKLAETTTDENGLYIFDELPAGKYTVKFTLTEEQAEKYVFTKQNADENSTKDSDADPETGWTKVIELNDENEHLTKEYTDQDFEATEGIDPTWDAGVVMKSTPMEPAKTRVAVEKVWVGKAEDKVTINLLANGEKVDTVELSEENDWKHTFTDLPTVHNITDEKAIEYTVEEVTVDGYNTEITGDAKEGFTVTNTRKSYAIGDYTWIDFNGDGIQDENEPVLPRVIVELYDEEDNLVAETETDENGLYIFDELEAGNYKVKFTLTEEQAKIYEFTKQNSGEDTAVDSDADPETGWTIEITLDDNNEYLTKDYEDQEVKATEGIDPTWDAGVVLKSTPMEPAKTKVSVEKVWKGQATDSVTINLLADGKKVDSVNLSDANDWKHTFTDLLVVNDIADEKAIEYTVEEVKVEGYNTEITGDAKEGFIITNTQKTYAIGDYTWIDSNKDGIQDEDEEVLPGVKVELYDEDGNKVAETVTDENGFYIFDELPAGKYKVKFTLTEEQAKKYEFTKQNAGDDSTVDSDADENGWTIEFTLDDENEYLTKNYTDQDFKATEGIDPTWDAGVIEKIVSEDLEEPTDPEKPQVPQDPKDPKEPGIGDDSGDKDHEDSTDLVGTGGDGKLPKTATNIYNLTLIGIGLMLLGLIVFLVRRKRIE